MKRDLIIVTLPASLALSCLIRHCDAGSFYDITFREPRDARVFLEYARAAGLWCYDDGPCLVSVPVCNVANRSKPHVDGHYVFACLK